MVRGVWFGVQSGGFGLVRFTRMGARHTAAPVCRSLCGYRYIWLGSDRSDPRGSWGPSTDMHDWPWDGREGAPMTFSPILRLSLGRPRREGASGGMRPAPLVRPGSRLASWWDGRGAPHPPPGPVGVPPVLCVLGRRQHGGRSSHRRVRQVSTQLPRPQYERPSRWGVVAGVAHVGEKAGQRVGKSSGPATARVRSHTSRWSARIQTY